MRSTSSLVSGNEIQGVDPQRGHSGNAVVRQREQGAGEYIIEAAHYHVGVRQPPLCNVHCRQILDVVGETQRWIVADFAALDYGYRGRGVENFLLSAGSGYHALREKNDLFHQGRIQPGGLTGPHLHVFPPVGLVADKRDFDLVISRWNGDAELSICIRYSSSFVALHWRAHGDIGTRQSLPRPLGNHPLDKALRLGPNGSTPQNRP